MRFMLVCEGSSDAALREHILTLLDGRTPTALEGDVCFQGRRLADKIRGGFNRHGECDLLFVHRDANSAGAAARYREIAVAVREVGYAGPWVGIVPVRMTEAWLLLDEAAIRQAAESPRGRAPLNLPSPRAVERIADPKSTLEAALLRASESRGRRRHKDRRVFSDLRHQLLQNLPPGGPLEQVPSWARFRDDTIAAVQSLASPDT